MNYSEQGSKRMPKLKLKKGKGTFLKRLNQINPEQIQLKPVSIDACHFLFSLVSETKTVLKGESTQDGQN